VAGQVLSSGRRVMSLAEYGEQEKIGRWIHRRAGRSTTDPYLRRCGKLSGETTLKTITFEHARGCFPRRGASKYRRKTREGRFLFTRLELAIGDTPPRVELVDGSNLIGALVEVAPIVLFATN